MGFAVVAVDMAEWIGLADLLNQRIYWDLYQRKVSPQDQPVSPHYPGAGRSAGALPAGSVLYGGMIRAVT
jgi:hypothetical protein